MDMLPDHDDQLPLPDIVFERTDQGRLVALRADHGLSLGARRLLLMMTGYTPLADLLALMDDEVPMDEVAEVVEELQLHQLIRPVYALSVDGLHVHWFGSHRVPHRTP